MKGIETHIQVQEYVEKYERYIVAFSLYMTP
jgi:hypothetical protein